MRKHGYAIPSLVLSSLLLVAILVSIPAAASSKFPTVELSSGGHWISGITHTINLPSTGGFQTGDLLIATFCGYQSSTELPVPWALFDSAASYPNGKATIRTWYRIASAGMSSTVQATSTGTVEAYQVYRIVGHKQASPSPEPESNTSWTISSENASVNPPILVPSYGTKDTLWLALACAESDSGTNLTISTIPTGFTDLRQDWADAGGPQNVVHSAFLKSHVSSKDPAAFTASKSVAWSSVTVSIEPQDSPPIVTLSADTITAYTARLRGRLDTLFSSTVVLWFDYGDCPSCMGNETANVTRSSTGTYSLTVSGLAFNTTYYFRAHSIEVPSGYEAIGDTLSFTTLQGISIDQAVASFWIFVFLSLCGFAILGAWWIRERWG